MRSNYQDRHSGIIADHSVRAGQCSHMCAHISAHNRATLPVLALLATLAAGCGNSTTSPTAPTPQPPPIPALTGQWTGTYTVTSCTETGSAIGSNFCANLGQGGRHTFTPQQSGSNLSGSLGLGTFAIQVTGNVGTDQVVVLSGSGPIISNAVLTLNTWRATVAGSTMAGTMAFTILVENPIGTAQVNATTALAR